jgi:anti-sigma B factor antagonist
MILDVTTRTVEPDITVFELAGRLTLGNLLSQAEHALRASIDGGCRKLVIDLARLDFMDSAGIGMLAMCAGLIGKAGGEFRVAGANGRVQELLEIVRLGQVVTLAPDVEQACRSLQPGSASAA